MNSAKQVFSVAFVALFVAAAFVATSPVAQATGSTAVSASYSYPSSSNAYSSSSKSSSTSKGSTAVSASYSYSSSKTTTSNSTSGVTHYDTGCCTTSSSGSTAVYATYSYAPTYTTPTYTTTYTSGGCSSNCGGSYTPPSHVTPTCSISVSKSNVYAGETITVGWSSTNSSYGNISNFGSFLPTSGSHSATVYNTTTFSGTFYGVDGGTASCFATVYVNQNPAPTCSITGPDTATAGQTITLNWSSTNATRGDIQNLGTNLAPNDSHSFTIGNTTTFYGTFYGTNGQTTNCQKTVTVVNYCPAGYSGTYPNCYPPQNNNLSCTISINNYANGYNNYFAPNSAVTLSWNSNGASYGSINQGLGSVGASGSRTIYPTQTTTYTGTFYNYNGQQVTCSATVYVNGYVPPNNGTPIVTLSQVPYTGLDLGPVGTVLYWGFIAFWCALAAYLIVVKKVQNSVYGSLKTILFGSAASHAAAHTTHVAHVSYAAPVHEDVTDPFITAQINRIRG